MVDLYVMMIRKGMKKLEDVPESLRAQVEEKLHADS